MGLVEALNRIFDRYLNLWNGTDKDTRLLHDTKRHTRVRTHTHAYIYIYEFVA